MLNWLKAVIWDNRNEPLLVAICAGLLVVVVWAMGLQVRRQAPLVCDGTILPASSANCPARPELEPFPVGTVVAFFGPDNRIPNGWKLLDGQQAPENSTLGFDADPAIDGEQLPDLRGKFIRGSSDPLQPGNLVAGGRDITDLSHSHRWARFEPEEDEWYSYTNRDNRFAKVDNWNDGIDDGGSGEYPLLVEAGRSLYTERVGNDQESNLPSHVELRWIIRVF